jgi:hypothetical protein
VDTQTTSPVSPSFSGFAVNLLNDGLQHWDTRLVGMTREFTPGHLRFNSSSVYHWQTGWISEDFMAEFASNADKYEKYESYRDTIRGFGYLKLADIARLAQQTGARLMIIVNARTDSADSAGDLARLVIERGYDVVVWELDSEPVYWSDGNSNPQAYDGGYGYADEMEPYFEAIQSAYEAAGIPAPMINLSTSDGGENDRHATFDGMDLLDGYDPTTDELGLAGYGSTDDPDSTHEKYWTGWSHHWYPGHKIYIEADGTVIDHDDETAAERHWEIFQADVNHRLVNAAVALIDDYFLPVNGPDGLQDTPGEDFLGSITEFNVRFTTDYTGSAYAGVHAAESILRWSAHERLAYVTYFALTAQGLNWRCNNRQNAKSAGNNNRVLDTNDNDYDLYWSMSGLALQLVNRAVNTADLSLETTLSGGVLDTAIEAAYAYSEAASKWGWIPQEATEVTTQYAMTYRGRDGVDRLILTNRSGEAHTVTVTVDGTQLVGPLHTRAIHADEALFENDGSDIDCDTGLSDEVLDLEITEADQDNPLTLPPWSVMVVDWERAVHEGAPDPPVATLTPEVEALAVAWDPVPGATGYRVSWGVTSGTYTFSEEVTDPGFTISPYQDGIDLYVVVSALNASGESLPSEEKSDQTAPDFLGQDAFDATVADYTADDGDPSADDWEAGCGSTASWSSDGNVLSVSYESSGKHCLLHTASNAVDQRVRVRIRVPEWTAGEDSQRIGLVGRYQDHETHVAALIDYGLGAARIMVLHPELPDGFDVVARTNDLDVQAMEGEWTTLEMEMDGQTLRLWLGEGDERRLVAAGLDDFDGIERTGAGTAGVYARRQAMDFDDFEVR